MSDEIPFDRSLDARADEAVDLSPLVRRLIANNGGPYTFTGTCTYVVGHGDTVVIDPGPVEAAHRDAILRLLQGRPLKAILVTHSHRDHSPGAASLKTATGAPIFGPPPTVARSVSVMDGLAADAAHDRTYAPDVILAEGDSIDVDGARLTALATPGHTANHLAYALDTEASLFSGDHVMAWSTTVIAPPDGSMHAYMGSLEKLLGRPEQVYWPGHGGPVRNPQRFVRALLHHRRQREHAILAQVHTGAGTIERIVGALYDGLAPALRGAAALTVLAHLENLEARDLVTRSGDGASAVYAPAGPGQFSAA